MRTLKTLLFSTPLFLTFLFFVFIFLYSLSTHPFPNTPTTKNWVAHGAIYSVVQTPDGTTYIGGDFDQIGAYTGSGVPVNALQGTPLAKFPKVNGTVFAIAPDGKGGWYIGGNFNRIDETEIWGLAHIAPDYSIDPAFKPRLDGTVYALATKGDVLYVGGSFQTVQGQPFKHLAKFEKNILDQNFKPNPDNWVWVFALKGDVLFIGGDFQNILDENGMNQPIQRLAKFNKEKLDTKFNPNPDGFVRTLTINTATLYVGGEFKNIYDERPMKLPMRYLVRFAKDPFDPSKYTLDIGWTPNPDNPVLSSASNEESTYVGGNFDHLFDENKVEQPIQRLAKFKNGLLDLTFNMKPGDLVKSLVLNGEILYVGGFFKYIGGQPVKYLAKFNKDVLDPNWKGNPDDKVLASAVSGETLFVGGGFQNIGGEAIKNLAKFNQNVFDPNFKPNPDSRIQALALIGENLYVGGNFQRMETEGGDSAKWLARFKINTGKLDLDWKPQVDNYVATLATNGETLYVGGAFQDIEKQPQPVKYLARFNNGIFDTNFKPNPDNLVLALATTGDVLYVGGAFKQIAGEPINSITYLAKFDKNGLDPNWKANRPNPDNWVLALALNGETLYVGGGFQKIGPEMIPHLAKFEKDILNTKWVPEPRGVNSVVSTLALSGGTLYVGGQFSTIGGKPLMNLARFNHDKLDSNWNPNPNYPVRRLAFTDTLYVGGDFDNVGGLELYHSAQFPYFIQFAQSTMRGDRNAGLLNIEVSLSEPDPFNNVIIDYKVSGGTAKKGEDYHFNDGKLIIPIGETTGTIPLSIINNNKQGDLTIEISLLNPTGVFLGSNNKFTYTITPNPPVPPKKEETPPPPPPPPPSTSQKGGGGCALTTGNNSFSWIFSGILWMIVLLSFPRLWRRSPKSVRQRI